MAHIQVPEGAPGILGPMAISPESTKALRELVEVLLRGPNTLTLAEREMIAMYVSSQNNCYFCQLSHGAAAAEHLGGNYDLIDRVKGLHQRGNLRQTEIAARDRGQGSEGWQARCV